MKRSRSVTPLACEALNSIYEFPNDDMVSQAINCDLILFLLSLLGSPMEYIPNPSGTKAHIVKALKSMTKSLAYGDKVSFVRLVAQQSTMCFYMQVSTILDASKIWAEFKDQRHDLFITQTNTMGRLTGG